MAYWGCLILIPRCFQKIVKRSIHKEGSIWTSFMVIDKPEQERPQKARKNLLDSGSLKGQQARHKLGVHPGQVCLRISATGGTSSGVERRKPGWGSWAEDQLNLWKAAHLSTRKNRGIRTGVLMPETSGRKRRGLWDTKFRIWKFCSVPPSSKK